MNQTYKNVEVIVVDKFSNDNTIEITKKYRVDAYQIKAKERSEQRNFGAVEAKGKFVCFIDSDMELTPKVIEVFGVFQKTWSTKGLTTTEMSAYMTAIDAWVASELGLLLPTPADLGTRERAA